MIVEIAALGRHKECNVTYVTAEDLPGMLTNNTNKVNIRNGIVGENITLPPWPPCNGWR
jgi:hypothetical protein